MKKRIGVYCLHINGGGGAEKASTVMAEELGRLHDVTLIVGENCDRRALETYFGVDLSNVRILQLNLPVQNRLRRLVRTERIPFAKSARADLFLRDLRRVLEPLYYSQIKRLDLDFFINDNGYSILPCPARRGIYMCMFPHEMRGGLRLDRTRGLFYRMYAVIGNRVVGMTRPALDSYDMVVAYSCFIAEWVRTIWRVDARVVYPPCESMGPPAAKEKIILHVGRFVGEGRNDNKHQHTLLKAFERSSELRAGGWQLHFAGSVLADANTKRTVERLVRAARGYAVTFWFNADFETLRSLYRRASIYWHATGYGFSPEEHPGKQEHFGITTAEAMSAGAVPVVINSGGQRETVTQGVTGFLWNNLDEMTSYTERLAADEALRIELGRNAVAGSARFSRAAFAESMEQLADELLSKGVGRALGPQSSSASAKSVG
jgi:glycosyltransferase involved in cell wall biosynthesis